MKPLPLLLAFFTLAASLALAADEKEKSYSIKYNRRAEVGDVYEIHSTIKTKRTPVGKTTMEDILPGGHGADDDADSPHHADVSGELKGKIEVESVDSNGSPKDFMLTVKSLKRNDDDEVIGEGTRIHVKRSADTVDFFEPNGENEPIDSDTARFLSYFIVKLNEADATDDDIFRSNKLRKVGDKWEADYDALENSAAGEQVKLDLKGTSLSVTLKEVRTRDRKNNLVVAIDGKFKYKKIELPEFIDFVEASSTIRGEYILPEDKTVKSHDLKLESEFLVKARRKSDGREVTYKDVIKRSATVALAKPKE
jgi:hypothetical protein